MNLDARKSALAMALGMALAACGGSQDGTSDSSPVGKAVPGTDGTDVVTKAPGDTPPIRKDADSSIHLRGDVLIQALLSQVGEHDASNQPHVEWLDPDSRSHGNVGSPQDSIPLTGPVALVTRDVQAATPEDAALGRNIFQMSLAQGPMRGSPDDFNNNTTRTHPFNTFSFRFGVSQAGLPRAGNGTATASAPLEIGRQLNLAFTPTSDDFDVSPVKTEELTLTSKAATTIQPDQYYKIYGTGDTWEHVWRTNVEQSRTFSSIGIEIGRPSDLPTLADSPNQFQLCFDVEKAYDSHQFLCDVWEVPTDWRAGQPLKRVRQVLREHFFSELGSSTTNWTWNDRKGTAPLAPDALRTTTQPVSAHGISGAVLAALFDAFTPRAQGMKSLPARASRSSTVLGTTLAEGDPQYVSLYHESRATRYADGATDASTYSPATGSYLYAFRSGAWQASDKSRVPTQGVRQQTLALHVTHDPQKGFILPRWTGLNQLGIDHNNEQHWLYQGEQVGEGNGPKTIAANDLILFGSTVQSWHDPKAYSDDKESEAMVVLSVEQAGADPRSVDLCWFSNSTAAYYGSKACTTWVIPEGWQPGQVLKPQGYRITSQVRAEHAFWNTGVSGN